MALIAETSHRQFAIELIVDVWFCAAAITIWRHRRSTRQRHTSTPPHGNGTAASEP